MKLFHVLALICVLALFGCSDSGTTPEGEQAALAEETAAAPEVTYTDYTVPAGTILTVQFLETISSDTNIAGDTFNAQVLDPVMVNGFTVIEEGSVVSGSVLEVIPAKKIGAGAQMSLEFTRVRLLSGDEYPISAMFTDASEGAKKKDAATIGGAAAGGALLGRIIGHKKDDEAGGTAIGAVVGAAVGTAIAANNENEPVVIEEGAVLDLLLEGEVTVQLQD